MGGWFGLQGASCQARIFAGATARTWCSDVTATVWNLLWHHSLWTNHYSGMQASLIPIPKGGLRFEALIVLDFSFRNSAQRGRGYAVNVLLCEFTLLRFVLKTSQYSGLGNFAQGSRISIAVCTFWAIETQHLAHFWVSRTPKGSKMLYFPLLKTCRLQLLEILDHGQLPNPEYL